MSRLSSIPNVPRKVGGENFQGEIFRMRFLTEPSLRLFVMHVSFLFFLSPFSFVFFFFALSLYAREILSLVIFQVWTIDGDHGGW